MTAPATAIVASPIDPLADPLGARYEDDLVVVGPRTRPSQGRDHLVCSEHFDVWWERERLHLRHGLARHQIDNDIAGLLATELFATGAVSGSDTFERLLTGIVLGGAVDAQSAWEAFYRNTLGRLEREPGAPNQVGSLAGYAPVYRHAADLVPPGSVLELGCCFGFLSLQLAARGRTVIAGDVCAGAVHLLSLIAPRLGRKVVPLVCDATHVALADRSVDTVVAAHLLEHMEPDLGRAVLDEAIRIARRRVVIAVPYEDEPAAVFGHVRAFTADHLWAMGRRDHWDTDVHSSHGGWLVMDRAA